MPGPCLNVRIDRALPALEISRWLVGILPILTADLLLRLARHEAQPGHRGCGIPRRLLVLQVLAVGIAQELRCKVALGLHKPFSG